MRSIIFCLAILSFVTSSTCALADSTAMGPHLNLSTQQPYTQAASVPTDQAAFAADTSNACAASGETRDACYVRYTVTPVTNSAAGATQYTLLNSSLACPAGYFVVASFDNKMLDPSNPSTLIYYSAPDTQTQVTYTNYYNLIGENYSCTDSGVFTGTNVYQCIDSSCGGALPTLTNINGFMGWGVDQGQQTHTTINGGVDKCEYYSPAGCPSWCSHWQWDSMNYDYTTCTRDAGFYTSMTEVPPTEAGAVYTPSVVICSKPGIVWKTQSQATSSSSAASGGPVSFTSGGGSDIAP